MNGDRAKPETDPLRNRLEAAAAGLVFSSESDRPFEFIRFPGVYTNVASLTPAAVADLIGAPGARAQEWPVERMLEQHIGRVDPLDARSRALIPRYESLAAALTGSFPLLRMFRIGTIEIRVLLLGNDPRTGEISGLSTVAVET